MNNKFKSRKFLIAVSGMVSGIALIISGNVSEGVTALVASAVGYLVAEGIIDMNAVNSYISNGTDDEDF